MKRKSFAGILKCYVDAAPLCPPARDIEIVDVVLGDEDEAISAADEKVHEAPSTSETRSFLRLLRNKVECSGGEECPMRCVRALEEEPLIPESNAHQTLLTSSFDLQVKLRSHHQNEARF